MRKMLALVLGTVMVLSLAACGNKADTTTAAGTTKAETTKAETTKAETTKAETKEEGTTAGEAGGSGSYKAGTYEGSGTGMGAITVSVTIDDSGKITAVDIVGDGETAGIGGLEAIQNGDYEQMILDAQSTEIDNVSGATLTTKGVIKAVDAALALASE